MTCPSAAGGLAEQSPEGQLRELEGRLARSAAAWKVVVGHHPIRSNHRERHEVPELVRQLEPLLQRYGVQVGGWGKGGADGYCS